MMVRWSGGRGARNDALSLPRSWKLGKNYVVDEQNLREDDNEKRKRQGSAQSGGVSDIHGSAFDAAGESFPTCCFGRMKRKAREAIPF